MSFFQVNLAKRSFDSFIRYGVRIFSVSFVASVLFVSPISELGPDVKTQIGFHGSFLCHFGDWERRAPTGRFFFFLMCIF